MTTMKFKTPLIVFFASLFFMVFSLQAQEASLTAQKAPELVVKDTINAVVKNIQSNRELYERDPEALNQMLETTLVPSLHITRIAGLVLGKKVKRSSTPQQIDDFAEQFQKLLIKTNAIALLDLVSDESVVYNQGGTTKLGSDRVKVHGTLVGADGSEYPITLHMSNRSDTQWRAYNMEVSGGNLVALNRSTLEPTLKKKGIDGLTEDLRAKYAQ